MSVQKSVDRLSLSRREEAFERQFLRRLQSWNRQSLWPGIILCAVLTWLAWVVSRLPFHPFTLASGQHPIGVAALALAFGIMVGNALPSTIYFKRGTDIVIRRILPIDSSSNGHCFAGYRNTLLQCRGIPGTGAAGRRRNSALSRDLSSPDYARFS